MLWFWKDYREQTWALPPSGLTLVKKQILKMRLEVELVFNLLPITTVGTVAHTYNSSYSGS